MSIFISSSTGHHHHIVHCSCYMALCVSHAHTSVVSYVAGALLLADCFCFLISSFDHVSPGLRIEFNAIFSFRSYSSVSRPSFQLFPIRVSQSNLVICLKRQLGIPRMSVNSYDIMALIPGHSPNQHRTILERNMLNITYSGRRTNIWVRENTQFIDNHCGAYLYY